MRGAVFTLVVLALMALALVRPFVGVLLWCWISFMNPHQIVWGFASGMPWATMVFAATLVGCALAGEPRRPPVNALTALILLLMLCITATSFTALAPPDRVWDKWEWIFKVLVGLLLTGALLTDRWRIHALVWLIVISLGYFGVRGGIFTIVTGGGYIVMGPPGTTINDRNQLAVALLVALPLMNYLRLQSPHRAVRWGLVAAMVLTLFAVVGSQSRGALVALAATALFLWARTPKKLVSGMAIAAALAAVLAFMPDSWRERMHSVETYQEDNSAMGRVKIWEVSIRIALDHPLAGGGFMSMYQQDIVDQYDPSTMARAAHSIWLEVLGEHGFPTFVVWVGLIAAGVLYTMRLARLARDGPEHAWARDLARMGQVSIVAYATGGSFLSLSYWDIFWTLLVVLGAAHVVVVRALRERRAGEPGAAAGRRSAVAGVAGPRRATPAFASGLGGAGRR